jgi:hypothetical protein
MISPKRSSRRQRKGLSSSTVLRNEQDAAIAALERKRSELAGTKAADGAAVHELQARLDASRRS